MLSLLALTPLADAGTLLVEKRGLVPAVLWVDAEPKGKVKKKDPVRMELPEGPHEVWVGVVDDGVMTRCHGVVDVPAEGEVRVELRDVGCEGVDGRFPKDGKTFFRGASVQFVMDSEVDAWVSVDGGRLLSLSGRNMLNLAPGTHTIVLYGDVHKNWVFDQGTVRLEAGQVVNVTCTTGGCMGFDAPAIVLIDLGGVPTLQLNLSINP